MMKNKILMIIILVAIMVIAQPACKKFIKPVAVLLFDESINGFAEDALDNLAIAYTKVTDYSVIVSVLESAEWDLIVFDNPNRSIGNAYSLLYDYVTRGGRLVISTWTLNNGHQLWGSLGYTYVETLDSKADVLRLNKLSSLWRDPFATTDLDLEVVADNYYSTNAQPGSASGSGELFATFETGNPSKGAVFVANSNRTILNAFLLDDAAIITEGIPSDLLDSNGNGIPDGEEWWTNEIKFVCSNPGQKVQPVMPASISSIYEDVERNSR